MKFATAKEHRDFFNKYGLIEFEGLLSFEQIDLVNQAINLVLAERLKTPSGRVDIQTSENLFMQGRDLWRANPYLQKIVTQSHFAQIVSELIEKKPLRLGYDQFLPSYQQKTASENSQQLYSQFLEKNSSVESVSCLSEVACGLLLSLNDRKDSPQPIKETSEVDIFPSKKGNIIFFKPDILVKWSHLNVHLGQRFYMIVYTHVFSHYQLQMQDPHTHALKRLGYVFNDKLSDRIHPIVYR